MFFLSVTHLIKNISQLVVQYGGKMFIDEKSKKLVETEGVKQSAFKYKEQGIKEKDKLESLARISQNLSLRMKKAGPSSEN